MSSPLGTYSCTIGRCRFIPADQQDCRAARIECIKDPVRTSLMLDSELAHCLCRDDSTPEEWGIFSVGPASESNATESRRSSAQQCRTLPPVAEFIRKLDFPRHI